MSKTDKQYVSDILHLIEEWDAEKNSKLGLEPEKITVASGKKVWWKCSKGHEWQATVGSRYRGNNCPYCAGQRVVLGVNDLATLNPNLVTEWDNEKNGSLLPTMVMSNSGKKVWWKCSICEYRWEAKVVDRNKGKGCPCCAGRKVLVGYNDLATLNPRIAEEWDNEKNEDLLPMMVTAGSGKKVWWKCNICGHSWKARVVDRGKGRGCPNCKNSQLSMIKLIPKQGKSLFDLNPYIANEWHPIKNNNMTPKDVNPSAKLRVWWLCRAGHEWQDSINHRSNGRGCPICHKGMKTSYPEQCIYFYIKRFYGDAVNRYKENNKEIDIFIPSLKFGIEYDGIYWHSGEKSSKEQLKDNYFLSKGIKILRIKESKNQNNDLIIENNVIYYYNDYGWKNLEAVIKQVLEIISQSKLISSKSVEIDINKDNVAILELTLSEIKNNNVLTNPILVKEWNYDKNGLLNPEFITLGSTFKVWWKCDLGHEWQATVGSRNSGKGCPICANQVILKGYNDLATVHSSLLEDWDYLKNSKLLPTQIGVFYTKNVWWKCHICGGEWQATVVNRHRGRGCPYCSNRKVKQGFNDLASLNPSLALEWNCQKNGDLLPTMVSQGSSKKVWWICSNCGNEYQTSVSHRNNGTGCPYCSGRKVLSGFNDLVTTDSDLAAEWDLEKNSLSPTKVTSNSGKKVWWKCNTCGYSWETRIADRNRGHGCPMCSRNKHKN